MFEIKLVKAACETLIAEISRQRLSSLTALGSATSSDRIGFLDNALGLANHRLGEENHARMMIRYLDQMKLPDNAEVHLSLQDFWPLADYFPKSLT